MRKRSWLAFGMVGALSAVFACADIFGFQPLSEPDGQVPDGGSDGDTCNHATYPLPPDAGSSSSTNALYFVLQHVYFSTTPDSGAPVTGYDLDHVCTTGASTSSCVTEDLQPSGYPIVDLAGGVDQESFALLNLLTTQTLTSSVATSLTDVALNVSIARGDFSIILTLKGYGGEPNVTGVTVGVQASPGLTTVPDAAPPTPGFDGGDSWNVSSADCVTPTNNYPSQTVTMAYVTNNVLVATQTDPITLHINVPSYLPNDAASAVFGPLTVILHSPVMTATIKKRPDGVYALSGGVIAGRWAAGDALQAIGLLTTTNGTLCQDDNGAIFAIVAPYVCKGREIMASSNADASAPCDALSVAVGFDAVGTNIGSMPTSYPSPLDGGCTYTCNP
jgi:hypothetical protein